MAKEEKKAPKLRFNGYTNDWERKKLGEIGSVSMNKRIFKDETSTIGEIPFYKIGTFGGKADAFITRKKYEEYKKKYPYPQKGNLLISASGSIGRIIEYNGEEAYYQDSNIVWLDHDNTILDVFLKPTYEIIKWDGIEGTTIKRLYNKNILNTVIYKPNIDEQRKIGKLFIILNNTVQLHERKCEELTLIKKALLQKLFPKKDEFEPEVRYKNFSDAWEQRRLGEVADVRDGTHDSPKYINEGYPLLTSKNVGDGYINYDDVKYVSENDYVQINKRSKVDVNDILMGMIGTIGNLALIREEPDFAIKNVALIKHTSNFDYQFLFQELQTSAISKELLSGMDGGTQKFVSLKKIRNLSVMLPSENEQKKIGSYLMRFDSLIALHQRKLEKLKQLKKFLLQNMFI